jgi:triphosphatase
MLKSDATPVRKHPSARDGNPVAKDNKRTQVITGFFRQREPAGVVAEPVIDQTPSQDVEPATEPLRSSAAAHGAGEIELKLLVDAGRMAHFNAAPVIAANARNKGTRKHLKSAYYDTPE